MRIGGRAPLCVREAALDVVRRPVRSLLALQAIVWGVATAIFPRAIFEGSRQAALTRSGEFASDRVIVAAPGGDDPVLSTWEEIETTIRNRPEVDSATGLTVRKADGLSLAGTDRSNLDARRLLLESGRNFTDEEVRSGAPVCILEAQAARDLFPGTDPVGRMLAAPGGAPLEVIGVLRPRPEAVLRSDELGIDKGHAFGFIVQALFSSLGVAPTNLGWLNTERNVLVPWTRLREPPRFLVLRVAPERVRTAVEDLRREFALRGVEVVVYANLALQLLTAPEIEGLISVGRDVFFLCLLMGMVVVANVTLLSVNERRHEIAIRRCEGATTGDIVLQFLLETMVFCLAGAALGIPLGILLAWVRVRVDPAVLVSWAIPWGDVALTLACVSLGGLVAGLVPAWRAARLQPVEVLSHAC